MKDMEQMIAAKDAFLAALDAMPDNVAGMCALTLTDRNEEVIVASNTPDALAAARCLSGLAAFICHYLDLPEEQAVSMLTVTAATMLAGMHPQLAIETGELGVYTGVVLFTSAVAQFPGAVGMCAGMAQDGQDQHGSTSPMSKGQAVELCGASILGVLNNGIVPANGLEEFLDNVREYVLQRAPSDRPQRAVRRRPRRRGGSPIQPRGSKKK